MLVSEKKFFVENVELLATGIHVLKNKQSKALFICENL